MRSVLTSDAPRPAGPYSQAIVSGDLVWCSGQLGIDPASGDIVGGAKEQAAQCLRNLDAVLKAAGSCSKHIVRTTVLVTDIKFMQGVNEAYSEFFGPRRAVAHRRRRLLAAAGRAGRDRRRGLTRLGRPGRR